MDILRMEIDRLTLELKEKEAGLIIESEASRTQLIRARQALATAKEIYGLLQDAGME